MALADKQREVLIQERGSPVLTLEFDVFADGRISMWTHFNHSDDFYNIEAMLVGIQNHLVEFIKDRHMCPFHRAHD